MTDADQRPDVIEAQGEGCEVFDAPALFFLTHEQLSRRWAELGERAREAAEEYIGTTLQPGLSTVGADRGLVPSVMDTNGGYRHLFLSFAGAPLGGNGEPCLAFCFGWQRKNFRITKHTYTPFVAVRVSYGGVGAVARAEFLDGANGEARRLRETKGYRRSNEWPVWLPLYGEEQWWADLDPYRAMAVGEMARIIEIFHDHAHRAVAHAANGHA